MIDKIALVIIISLVVFGLKYHNHSYQTELREYYYCMPYDLTQDPSIPPLTKLEIINFEKNYPNFTVAYYCEQKLYTRKQFHIMRKARK